MDNDIIFNFDNKQSNINIDNDDTNKNLLKGKLLKDFDVLNKFILDIYKLNEQFKAIEKKQAPEKSASSNDINAIIDQNLSLLTDINSIRRELCRLPLEFCEREYIINCILPLLLTIDRLSVITLELAASIFIQTNLTSAIVPPKTSKLKKTIRLVYELNKESEEFYKILQGRLKILIHNAQCE